MSSKLHNERAAVVEAAQNILAGAKGRDLNADEVTALEAKHADLARVDDLLAKSARTDELMDAFRAAGPQTPATQAKSAGEFFVKNTNLAGLKGLTGAVSAEFKAADAPKVTGGVGGVWGNHLTDQDPGLVRLHRRQLTIASLMGVKPVTGQAVTHMRQVLSIADGEIDYRAEGQVAAQVRMGKWEPVTEMIRDISVFTEVTDEVIADLDYVASIIDQDLYFEMLQKEEDELLNGAGGNAIQGLLNRGIQTETADGIENLYAALFRGANRINSLTGFSADGVVINPIDFENLALLKDADGRFLHSSPLVGQHSVSNGMNGERITILGLNTIVTPTIAQGQALIGAFQAGADVLRRQGLTVEASNAPRFHSFITTIRARQRLGLAVKRPGAFVRVNIG